MNHNDYDAEEIAEQIYELRCVKRRERGLPTTGWPQLDADLQEHWEKLVDRVVELLPDPKPEKEDDGL